jgi:hypothetical protein
MNDLEFLKPLYLHALQVQYSRFGSFVEFKDSDARF